MPEENVGATKTAARPIEDQILLRIPFLADFALARIANLPPGTSLRRRLVGWGLRHGFDAVARNDPEVVLLAYERDLEIFPTGASGVGFAEAYRGHQGFRDFASDFNENFVNARIAVKRVLDAGDRWVVDVGYVGRGETSGAEVAANWGTVYYLSPRGKIRRQHAFWGQDGWSQALKAAGLSE
jgi:ketosteroid isomerase-like protein